MSTGPDRWELGSLFHWPDFEPGGDLGVRPWQGDGLLLGCGRDAFVLLASMKRHRRWWVPSYFCQEVVDCLVQTGIDLEVYPDCPLEKSLDLGTLEVQPGDAILVMNYFGLRSAADVDPPRLRGVEIIEDHTHAPTSRWAVESNADFCLASLRKLFPLPDGGVLWSPGHHELPTPPPLAPSLVEASMHKLSGMLLKSHYLAGHLDSKEKFRELLHIGEEQLCGPRPSAMTELSKEWLETFPLAYWQTRRQENFSALLDSLPPRFAARVLAGSASTSIPFSAYFVFDQEEECRRIHSQLIDQNIFASRLWPLDEPRLDGIPVQHARLAARSFSVPIDMRYEKHDMERVGSAFRSLS